ncbi:2TM domain-containing protein [Actinomycetospora endophytica]|uniref:2TM domain-containing protein n=1 Tax=Actinomycetospora endophytica TaxID=2291215 RepID=A0ABS8PBT1_9PSEU|nr:2TM domain-containing protein [Actinomycetospora endophytica]MCD2195448.1 2TM domain-containing protein [Actinomycetospora endophytica]
MADDDPRADAIGRLKHRQSFQQNALIFAGVAVLLVVIWAISGAGYFWPVFPIVGLAIALGAQAFQLYGQRPISEDDIQREMRRRPTDA